MARAVELAQRGMYSADPNPRVGCVLVKNGRIVAEGWHERAGGPHAERLALAHAGSDAAGATAYVTLEPCNHTGRTGPCSEALIEAGVARVVCAGRDPNPLVDGAGIRRLADAGIVVAVGVLEESAAALNPGYRMRMTRGRPLIRSKLAASLDGRTALANGASQWITGEAARRDVHRWRARSSAVLTGIGTVLADDPGLDARLPDTCLTDTRTPDANPSDTGLADADLPGARLTAPRPLDTRLPDTCLPDAPAPGAQPSVVQPVRVILDSKLRTPPQARTLGLPGTVLIFASRPSPSSAEALRRAGARVEAAPGERHCDLDRVMARLGERQFNEVWVEAGARLNGALLRAGLIDELVIYVAPRVLGDDGRGMFAIGPLARLEESVQLEYRDMRRVGEDIRITACPAASQGVRSVADGIVLPRGH